MNRLFYSAAAYGDLSGIRDYLSVELESPVAAQKTIDNILNAAERLKEFPGLGAPLSSVAGIESEYRFLVCGNYLVFYREENSAVYVDRILYGRRDYLRILFGPSKTE